MKVSIIIPCWNQAQYLTEAIESVLGQTYNDIEIIVINDGSPDNTKEVAGKYSTVKLINQVNKGLSSARNTGIMNSTGDYILPLDADDKLLPDCVRRLVDVAIDTNADIIAPSFVEFGMSNAPVILMHNPTIEDFKVGNRLPYFSMVKKEALLEVGGYSPRMVHGYEDLHLWFDLLSRGKTLITLPSQLAMYRTKENSMISTAKKHHLELMNQIYKDFKEVWKS